VPVANNTTKSDTETGVAEGGDWRLEVEYDSRKLGQWAECVVGPNC
jgi:hypothetical protein